MTAARHMAAPVFLHTTNSGPLIVSSAVAGRGYRRAVDARRASTSGGSPSASTPATRLGAGGGSRTSPSSRRAPRSWSSTCCRSSSPTTRTAAASCRTSHAWPTVSARRAARSPGSSLRLTRRRRGRRSSTVPRSPSATAPRPAPARRPSACGTNSPSTTATSWSRSRRPARSSQAGAPLLDILRRCGVDTVLVAGTVTNVCCESSVRDAATLGFRVVLVADATAAPSDEIHNASVYRSFGDVRPAAEVLELLASGSASTTR